MTPQQRFTKYVDRTDTCWLWTGGKNPRGYGVFRVGHVQAGAHRWAWEWANGPITSGLEIHHTCRTRSCVNPAHLRLVTRRQNLQHRRMESWQDIDSQLSESDPLIVTLSPQHSSWVRALAAQSGLSPDEIVSKAMYRYMARWLGGWKDTKE